MEQPTRIDLLELDIDLRLADLSNANLDHANLAGANLTGVNLTDATITNTNLQGTAFAGATLTGVTTQASTGTPANLPAGFRYISGALVGPGAHGVQVNVNGANLASVDLHDWSCSNCTFTDTPWPTYTGTRTQVHDTRMSGAWRILRVSRTIFHSSEV